MSAVASCVEYASFFSIVGVISAVAFTCFGAAYGTAKSGVGIATIGVMRPDLIMKSVIPVVMAGIVAIYGLVISMMILNDIEASMALTKGFMQMGAGVSAGFAGLSSGFAIGVVGDAGVRGSAQQPRLFVGSILILIFAEVLGLYGLIVGLVLYSRSKVDCS